MEISTLISAGIKMKYQWNFGRLCFLLYKENQGAYVKYVFFKKKVFIKSDKFNFIFTNFQKLHARVQITVLSNCRL